MGDTSIYLAVEGHYHNILDMILTNSTSPDYMGPRGRSALHAAVLSNCEYCIDKLLTKNPALAMQGDELGRTPLHYLAYIGSVELMKRLIRDDRNVVYVAANEDENKTALHIAACQNEIGVMEELLTQCPDCWEMRTSKHQNVLHLTIENKAEKSLSYILSQSWVMAIINERDVDGNTPLHLYVKNAAKDFDGSQLVKHPSVDPNLYNNDQMTPYDLLMEQNMYETPFHKELQEVNAMRGLRNFRRHPFNNKAYEEEHKREKKWRRLAPVLNSYNTNLVVAMLIAAVAFLAGLTIARVYGGNDYSNQGVAILSRKTAFETCILADTIAMMSSILAASILLTSIPHGYNNVRVKDKLYRDHITALVLIIVAVIAMLFALVMGLYTLRDNSFAIRAYGMGCFIVLALCSQTDADFVLWMEFVIVYEIVKAKLKRMIGRA